MLYMLIVVSGLNVVEFDTYSTSEECFRRANDAVAETSWPSPSAYCLDSQGNKIMEAGRS